jgi:hypothetical protein
MVATFTNLNAYIVALLLTITGLVAGVGGRGRAGQARIALIVFIVSAVLIAVGGVAVGSTDGLTDPGVTLGSPGLFGLLIFPLAVIIASADNASLRNAAATNRKSYIIAVVVMTACTVVALFGLLLLTGGGFQVPSVQLETFVAYVPASLGGIIAGIFALVGGASAALTVNLVLDASRDLGPQVPIPITNVWWRSLVTLVVAAIIFAVAVTAPSPKWLVPTLAVVAIVGMLAGRVAKRSGERAEAAASEPKPEPEPASA